MYYVRNRDELLGTAGFESSACNAASIYGVIDELRHVNGVLSFLSTVTKVRFILNMYTNIAWSLLAAYSL